MRDHIAGRARGGVLVVGDRPETDIALARSGGWAGVLVLSGVTRSLEAVPMELAPSLVVGSLAELAAALE